MIFLLSGRYWAQRAALYRERRRAQGFNWAAGELLRGTPVADVLQKSEEAFDFGSYDAFDEGVVDACNTWEALRHGK